MDPADLSSNQKTDVERIYKRLKRQVDPKDLESVCAEADAKLDEALEEDLPAYIADSMKLGRTVVEHVRASSDLSSDQARCLIAGLTYLNDPWDVIPDFIPGSGLLDDAYLLNLAVREAGIAPDPSPVGDSPSEADLERASAISDRIRHGPLLSEDVLELNGNLGPHLAKRAKLADLLTGYQRKALFDIGRKITRGWELSEKQKAFYIELVEELVREGLMHDPCHEDDCQLCESLIGLLESPGSFS